MSNELIGADRRLAENIARHRRSLGMSQSSLGKLLADTAGLTISGRYNNKQMLIQRIESEARKVSAVELCAFAHIFGVRMVELLGAVDPVEPLASRLKNAVEQAIAEVVGGDTA